jgi:hypothetical protein
LLTDLPNTWNGERHVPAKHRNRSYWSLCIVLTAASAAQAQVLTLVTEGKSGYRIVTSANPAPPEQFAADELSRYLAEISGARLPVGTDAKGEQLVLIGGGAPEPVLAELKSLPEDAFIIRSQGTKLMLAGASPRATLYAVYAFLEDLGVGFPRPHAGHLPPPYKVTPVEKPGPGEETVPRRGTIALQPLNTTEKPSFSYRALVMFPMLKDRTVWQIDWMAKNRLNWVHLITNNDLSTWEKQEVRKTIIPEIQKRGMHIQAVGHTFFTFIPSDKYGASHPEYFSVGPDGKRGPKMDGLCTSNPEVVKLMAENMSKFLQENPEIEIIDLWTNDSFAWCFCPECKKAQGVSEDFRGAKWGPFYHSITRGYVTFVNRVAELLAQKHPKVKVNLLAYALSMDPAPEATLAPNVIVGLAPIGRYNTLDYYLPITDGSGPYNAKALCALTGWLEQTRSLYLYDYHGLRPECFSIVDAMRKDYAFYKRLGVDMVSSEIWSWPEFNMWAYGRLAWDHTIPLKMLIADYCRIAYRAAAAPMVKFHVALERYKWRFPNHWPELEGLLTQADRLAAEDPTVKSKLVRLREASALGLWEAINRPDPPWTLDD